MLNKKSRGFTLIELLVVIAIIAILAGIVFVNVRRARLMAHDAEVNALGGGLAGLAEIYYNQEGYSYSGFCASSEYTAEFQDPLGDVYDGSVTAVCDDAAGDSWSVTISNYPSGADDRTFSGGN